jgi:hypothetical protein
MNLDIHNRISDLEIYIENLQNQQRIIQNIERFVPDDKVHFADLMDTNALLTEEIERYQMKIHSLRTYENILRGR